MTRDFHCLLLDVGSGCCPVLHIFWKRFCHIDIDLTLCILNSWKVISKTTGYNGPLVFLYFTTLVGMGQTKEEYGWLKQELQNLNPKYYLCEQSKGTPRGQNYCWMNYFEWNDRREITAISCWPWKPLRSHKLCLLLPLLVLCQNKTVKPYFWRLHLCML